jgi:hypothetical protein
MKKPGALASALRSSGSAVAASTPAEADETMHFLPGGRPDRQSSRARTKAITVHFPEEVRRQLKAMAGEQGREVADMVAEGLNLLFAKYRKAELAPRKANK